jgi:hypothetical protein
MIDEFKDAHLESAFAAAATRFSAHWRAGLPFAHVLKGPKMAGDEQIDVETLDQEQARLAAESDAFHKGLDTLNDESKAIQADIKGVASQSKEFERLSKENDRVLKDHG